MATHQALSAQRANEATARAENEQQLAALSDSASHRQQAEHIRGLVAATMSQLSTEATAATRAQATQWQTWALALAVGLEHAAAPAVLTV